MTKRMTPPGATPQERIEFWSEPEPNSGCWLWTGNRLPRGYGVTRVNGEQVYAHRASYEAYVGPIPEGLHIDHLCKNPSCVNWQHLEAVTLRENNLRSNGFGGVNFRKTHCKRGHEFTSGNTHWQVTDNGPRRSCRTCRLNRPAVVAAVNLSPEEADWIRSKVGQRGLATFVHGLVKQAMQAEQQQSTETAA